MRCNFFGVIEIPSQSFFAITQSHTSRQLHNIIIFAIFFTLQIDFCLLWMDIYSKIPILFQASRLTSGIKQFRSIHSNKHQIQEAGVGKYIVLLAPFAAGAGVVAYAK